MIPTKEEWNNALEERHGKELHTVFSSATVAVCGLGGLGSNIVVLKCTGIQTEEVEDASETEIRNADLNTANSALFANPKVVDNFFATYITLMSENKNRK